MPQGYRSRMSKIRTATSSSCERLFRGARRLTLIGPPVVKRHPSLVRPVPEPSTALPANQGPTRWAIGALLLASGLAALVAGRRV